MKRGSDRTAVVPSDRSVRSPTTAAVVQSSIALLLCLASLASWSSTAEATLAAAAAAASASSFSLKPFQATGFKIGEVTDGSAIVWTRLTLRSTRGFRFDGESSKLIVTKKGGRRKKFGRGGQGGNVGANGWTTVEEQDTKEWLSWTEALEESAPGTEGYVRVLYRTGGEEKGADDDDENGQSDGLEWSATAWARVDPRRDYTHQFELKLLAPNARYRLQVESRSVSGVAGETLRGEFRTSPSPHDDTEKIVFTVSSCQPKVPDRGDGYNIYPSMMALNPRFFVHTGDIVYYDRLAKNVDIARHHWHWAYTWPTNVDFHRQVSSYFMKDDHDTWQDDCWPTMKSMEMDYFTFSQGQALFREQVPMGQSTFRTFRWGKHLQIWLVEGRDFRSPNFDPDGPEKTIWGKEQLKWFMSTVLESDATFRVLISPTPVVGPDRKSHYDNHANRSFKYEGSLLRGFLSRQDMIVICGDRHWQYMSVHDRTGVREYSVGPTTDDHTGNLGNMEINAPEHRYINVTSGGFLSATVESAPAREDYSALLTLRLHGVMGNVNFEDKIKAFSEVVVKEDDDDDEGEKPKRPKKDETVPKNDTVDVKFEADNKKNESKKENTNIMNERRRKRRYWTRKNETIDDLFGRAPT